MNRYLVFCMGALIASADNYFHAFVLARQEANNNGMAVITDSWYGHNEYLKGE